MNQMTIFDFVKVEDPDFHDMTEEEVVDYIGQRIGLEFKKYDLGRFIEYRSVYKNSTIDIHISHYTCHDREGEAFIACSFWNKKQMSGAGIPADSIEEAIAFFKKRM